MFKGVIFFLFVWVFIVVSISIFRSLSGSEKWSLVKTVAYAGLTAIAATAAIVLIVVIF